MKKIFLFASTLAGMFLAGSCQRENLETKEMSNKVTYTVKLPGALTTKADAENFIANYEVYRQDDVDNEDAIPIYEGSKPFENGSAHIELEFVKGQSFAVLFWAQKEGAAYNTEDLRKISLVASLSANNANYEVFAGKDEVISCVSANNGNISLVRPIAQLNIATLTSSLILGDAASSSRVNPEYSDLKVTGLYSAFNVATGRVVGEPCEVEYEKAAIKSDDTFGTDYTRIGMNYIGFIPQDGINVEVDFNIYTENDGEITHAVSNVPVKPNYKTNIIGNLISSDTEYNVTLESGWDGILASNAGELLSAIKEGGSIKIELIDNFQINNTIDIKAGTDAVLDLNGKTISIDADDFIPNSSGTQYAFIIREGGSLTIDGNGTVEVSTPGPVMFYPAGNLLIESGTFIRNIPEGYDGDATSMFVGTKPAGGWHSSGVTIKGGYFDSGYYDSNAFDIEDILAWEKTLEETEEDIRKRGIAGDKNKTRVALKNNVMKFLNKSNNYFEVYGGTFVGANPAWGDEGCMLPTKPNYLRPWSYYQGAFLEGQKFNEDGLVLPEGYTITKGRHEDGRPTYTVTYVKP